jgi:hypothetical protein
VAEQGRAARSHFQGPGSRGGLLVRGLGLGAPADSSSAARLV